MRAYDTTGRVVLLDAVTSTTTGSAYYNGNGDQQTPISAKVSGTGAVSATVKIYGSNQNTNSGGVLLMTISLSGTTSDSDGDVIKTSYPFLYADLTAISGTGAAVTADFVIGKEV